MSISTYTDNNLEVSLDNIACKCGNNCPEIVKSIRKEKINFTIEKAYENEENHERIFEAYATREEIDKQGDLVKADGLSDAIPIWLDRRGTILDSHTNKPIGFGLEYDNRVVKDKQAVWLKAQIFSGRIAHNIDDEAWDKIQKGIYKGLSIGGQTFSKFRECNEKQCYNVIPTVQLYEISVVEDPANGGALIIAKQNKEDKKMSENETEVKNEQKEAGNAKLDITVHVASPPVAQEVVKEDDECGCGNHEQNLLKEDDFCKCDNTLDHNLDKNNDGVDTEGNGSQYVDLFLSLNKKLDVLTREISDLKLEKAKKEYDDEEEEEEEGKKKKKYKKEYSDDKKKPKEDEEKEDDEEEEDEKKTTEDGLTSEPKGAKKKKSVSKSVTPRPGIINENPETTIGDKSHITKSPLLMDDIIKLTEGNNVNKLFEKIDDVVFKHQEDGDN